MLIQYFRGGDFLQSAFYNPLIDDFDLQILSASSTQIVAVNPGTGAVTTFTGTGFPDSPVPPLSGTLTGIAITDSSFRPLAVISDFSWGLQSTLTALEQAVGNDANTLLLGLLSLQPITLDASAAVEPIGGLSFLGVTSDVDVIGSDFGDTVTGGSGNDTLEGGDGNDVLSGTSTTGPDGEDNFYGGDGDDTLYGGTATNAYMNGGQGNDVIVGSTGFDLLGYTDSPGAVIINLATGFGSDGFGTTDTISGIEEVRGSLLADQLTGDALNNRFAGLGGNDTIDGGDGIDRVRYDRDIRFAGGGGGVTVNLALQTATDGFGNTDTLISIEQVVGSDSSDTIIGNGVANQLTGKLGDDRLVGDAGADTLYGGDGTDTLNGGTGDDFLFGGDSAADLRDVVYGGDGNDNIDGGYGNDELNGGNDNDTVSGGIGADTVIGNAGADTLSGGGGGDLLYGNDGADFLNGGFGYDRLNGGAAADVFFHQGVADHGSDWVQDYSAAEGDVLSVGIAGATASQFQVNFAVTPGAGSAAVAEAFIIYKPTGQILWALVDGGDDAQIRLQIGLQIYDLLS